ncbi:NAD-dependent epimerase/dehydratase family protein [Halobacteriovorax sp. JY17]|uniref:NAD-dependent epimerase/dehydratase family protein n=1 Tax=Halobacteriovorax sp. JY17 TaxID=2014617 RepID=UPI000C4BCD29|nr:NAD-dependent epimerase/dehydratase family protein [Halobacteriovorax sp. JY17]PIK14063.1 MAG: hypothetical protein CES88_13855 [Halobacteriovorax sp. JY17]
MTKVLIFGGNSFVGREVVVKLLDLGHKVITFNRTGPRDNFSHENLNTVRGDILNPDDLRKLENLEFDVIVDNVSVNEKMIENIISALRHRVNLKYVFTSSSAIYHLVRDLKENDFTESDVDVFTKYEKNPMFQDREWDYIQGKADCERALIESDFQYKLIVRPNVIVGKNDPLKRTNYFFERVFDSKGVLLPDVGENTYHLVYASNLVNFYMDLILNYIKTSELVVNYSQDEVLTNKKFISYLDDNFKKKTEIYKINKELFIERGIALPPFGKWGKYELDLTLLKTIEDKSRIIPVSQWMKDLTEEFLLKKEPSYAKQFRSLESDIISKELRAE